MSRQPSSLLARIDAVIFDCDGTLANTEALAREAWTRVLAPYGYQPTDQDALACLGHGFPAVCNHFHQKVKALPHFEKLWPQFSAIVLPLIVQSVTPFPDAVNVLGELQAAAVPIAVATSSTRNRLDATLSTLDLTHGIAATVAGDEVINTKPAPDVFLTAARLLRVPTARCLVVEDSQPGVEGALAAGMTVVAVRRDSRVVLSGAHCVVDELTIEALWIALSTNLGLTVDIA